HGTKTIKVDRHHLHLLPFHACGLVRDVALEHLAGCANDALKRTNTRKPSARTTGSGVHPQAMDQTSRPSMSRHDQLVLPLVLACRRRSDKRSHEISQGCNMRSNVECSACIAF